MTEQKINIDLTKMSYEQFQIFMQGVALFQKTTSSEATNPSWNFDDDVAF